MVNQVNKNEDWRYERKFILPKESSFHLDNYIKNNPYFFSEIYSSRNVNNIYLDTIDYRFFQENVNGLSNRKKIRIRWYGELFGHIKPTLEIKVKSGMVGKKYSFKLPKFILSRKLNKKDLVYLIESSCCSPSFKIDFKALNISLINSYNRSYYLSLDKKFRLTVDSKMIYMPASNINLCDFGKIVKVPSIILELKYSKEDNENAHYITNHFPYRLSKNSKYVNGLIATKSLFSKTYKQS